MSQRPPYLQIFWTFARNSLVRDMTFRANFIVECISTTAWVFMNIGFYLLLFQYADEIGKGTGWRRDEFFVFLATTMFINSIVQAFFMPNAEEFSESIRNGRLDFALLKPIDTQFLISLEKVNWSSLANFLVGCVLLATSLWRLCYPEAPAEGATAPEPLHLGLGALILYPLYVLCGVAILYSLMIALAATSIWLGRNQSLYDFWFYITNFSRYPKEIYDGPWGRPLQAVFLFVIPVLIVVNVPARILAQPLRPAEDPYNWFLAGFAIVAAGVSLLASRFLFQRALESYRSASS